MKRTILTAGVLGITAVVAAPGIAVAAAPGTPVTTADTAAVAATPSTAVAAAGKNIGWTFTTLGKGAPLTGKAKFSHKGDKVTVCDIYTDANYTYAGLTAWNSKNQPRNVGHVTDSTNNGKCVTKSFDKKVKEGTKVSIVLFQRRGNRWWQTKVSKKGRA